MRDSFVNSLIELASENDRVMLLTADLGFGIFDDYIEKFPRQFINIGVAEQNMIGVGTGLGLEGWTVFAYSIGNFSTLRCLEQIRNDACYHEANLNIVASGGGFTYGQLGTSHHATEDLSIMRSLPGVTVVAPGEAWESAEATKQLAHTKGVGYLRIEKTNTVNTRRPGENFQIGKARRVRDGNDVSIFATGGVVEEALKAADSLQKIGVESRVVSYHTLKPIDTEEIRLAVNETNGIITIEENNIFGGLGGLVSEVCMEHGYYPKFFKRIGLNDVYSSIVGDQPYLRNHYNINDLSIVESVKQHLL